MAIEAESVENEAKKLLSANSVGLRGFESHPPHQERYPLQAKVLEHAFWLKKEGYRESTIVSRVKLLAGLLGFGCSYRCRTPGEA
ncbi:MAG: hypothetical protein AUJ07_10830 [Crenarchaeota archaeon 13_1_40CM_3_53_5]|nr:MAG: hypothetical protein AUJ07_10830 [Crenarchaeota archaeon 13_1_40CM_3_53_5]